MILNIFIIAIIGCPILNCMLDYNVCRWVHNSQMCAGQSSLLNGKVCRTDWVFSGSRAVGPTVFTYSALRHLQYEDRLKKLGIYSLAEGRPD